MALLYDMAAYRLEPDIVSYNTLMSALLYKKLGWDGGRTEFTPPKTNMLTENPPFEDVFPIEHGDFPMSC